MNIILLLTISERAYKNHNKSSWSSVPKCHEIYLRSISCGSKEPLSVSGSKNYTISRLDRWSFKFRIVQEGLYLG